MISATLSGLPEYSVYVRVGRLDKQTDVCVCTCGQVVHMGVCVYVCACSLAGSTDGYVWGTLQKDKAAVHEKQETTGAQKNSLSGNSVDTHLITQGGTDE